MSTGIAHRRPTEALRDDAPELRRCVRDLLALSTLPALWKDHDARQIAESVAEALVSMLDAEFVHVRLRLRADEPLLELTRTRNLAVPDSPSALRRAVLESLPRQSMDATAEIPNPLGEGTVRIASAPIGLGGDAMLVAGSGRSDFPTEAQHLILRMSASQTAIAVDRWHAEADQRRFAALELMAEKVEHQRADDRLQELQLELFHAARLSTAGQMAAALAHELNQPLTAATNYVNAARRALANVERRETDTIREDMNEAARQVLRAGQIIRRLRDFASRGETEKRVENVVAMVEEASALVLTGAGTLGAELRFRFDPKASLVLADRIQVQQVLVNLIQNALEAMAESRRGELTVTTALLDEETVEIAIADSGPGLAKGMIDHLFVPFFSTKRRGMGLGLSICRTIVESHGGKVEASENPGGGLTFRFTLPASADECRDAD